MHHLILRLWDWSNYKGKSNPLSSGSGKFCVSASSFWFEESVITPASIFSFTIVFIFLKLDINIAIFRPNSSINNITINVLSLFHATANSKIRHAIPPIKGLDNLAIVFACTPLLHEPLPSRNIMFSGSEIGANVPLTPGWLLLSTISFKEKKLTQEIIFSLWGIGRSYD